MRPHYILFGAFFTVAVAMALGGLLLRWVAAPLGRQETRALSLPLGAAALSLVNFTLCATHMVYKGVFLAIGAVIFWLAWRYRPACRAELPGELPKRWKLVSAAGFGVFFVIYFLHAMAPEFSPDGSSYHLGIVARYLRHRGFEYMPWSMYANLSQGVELLYLQAFAFGRHSAAALVHLAFLVDLAALVWLYGRRAGHPVAGATAALLVFASPAAGIDGSSAYIDVAAANIAFTVFFLLEVWDDTRHPRLLPAVGLMAGYCFAAKYTIAVGIPYALAFVLWKGRGKRLQAATAVVLPIAVMVAPWLIKNWLWMRNPLSPFFNHIFRNPYVTIEFERQYSTFFRTYGLPSLWQVPWDVTVQGRMSGFLGPLFLLAPVGLVALRWRAGRRLLLGALVFLLTYYTNIGTRFLLPALPFVALAMALVVVRVRGLALALVVAHLVMGWPGVAGRYSDGGAWRVRKILLRQALRLKSEDDFLRRNLLHYHMARLIDAHTPPDARVLMFDGLPEAYTTRQIHVVYQSAAGAAAGSILWTPVVPDYIPTLRRRLAFPEQQIEALRVVQTTARPEVWQVSELRVLHKGLEVPRAPGWRLTARPFPWTVRDAFDNNPVTRWEAGEAARPGQFVQIEFGRPVRADAVLLELPGTQGQMRFRAEGRGGAGNWRMLGDSIVESEAAPPLGLRRAAVEELKRRGFTHMVVWRKDYGFDDFQKKAALWGIRATASDGDGVLYEL